MIITCEKCQTRFKVGDDKLAQGPIRVRCSKCNHVFMASAQGVLATTLPPINSTPTTFPPATPTAPTFPQSLPPALQSNSNATAVHQPFQPQSSSPPALSPTARAGIFRPPTTSMPVTVVTAPAPFRADASPAPFRADASAAPFRADASAAPLPDPFGTQATAAATPRSLDPFGLGPSAASAPFASAPPFRVDAPNVPAPLPRPATNDPFAGLGVSSAGARALDSKPLTTPPGALPRSPSRTIGTPSSALARPATQDPFAGLGTPPSLPRPPSKDPFAGIGAAPPSAAIDSARGPHLPSSTVPFSTAPSDPFAPGFGPAPDPFGAAPDAISADALFGTSKPADPFANLGAPPAPSQGMIPQPDPFAPRDSGSIAVEDADVQEMGPQSSAPFDSGDPFGSLDADDPVDATSLFTPPPAAAPAPSRADASPPPARVPEVNRLPSPPHSDPGRAMTTLRRLETVQRGKEIAWAAAQGVLFASFLVVAVVLARGGQLTDLARGDLRAAFGGGRATSELTVEDVRVNKRMLSSGVAVVVVTGAVRNRTDHVVAGARVEVRFGDDDRGTPAFGWAWSSVDGVDVDGLTSAEGSQVLSQRPPRSASLAPGDRAPFVVVGPAPAEGAKAKVVVSVATPPPERAP